MKSKHIVICLTLALSGAGLQAQDLYNLQQCKDMALSQNKKIANSLLEISASQESKKEAYTNFFPSASASGTGFTANKSLISINTPDMGFNLLKNGALGSITLSQPVFAGGKIIQGNKLAKLQVDVNKQQKRLTENEVLLQTENLYWEIVSLREKIHTINTLEEQLTVLRKDAEVSQKAGLINLNDVLQVKLKLNQLESDRMEIENGISLSKMSLCQLMGIEIEEASRFDIASTNISVLNLPQTYYVNHREALSSRAENDLLDKELEAKKLQTKIKRADYMPSVGIGATYSQDNLMDKWTGHAIAFVSVSIPISGWWGGSHAIKKQKLEEQIAYNSKIEGQEKLLIQMQNVKNQLDIAYKQILIAKESIEQAAENLRISNDQYKNGLEKMSNLLDAQSLLQQSKDKYVDSYAAYQKRCFEYLQVTGR